VGGDGSSRDSVDMEHLALRTRRGHAVLAPDGGKALEPLMLIPLEPRDGRRKDALGKRFVHQPSRGPSPDRSR